MNTQCYFCHQVLRNESVAQHAASCGYVLVPCVNKCGAYIPRNTKVQHNEICRNSRMKPSKSTESLISSASGYDTFPRSNHAPHINNKIYYQQHAGTLPRSFQSHGNHENRYQSQQLLQTATKSVQDVRYDDLAVKFHLVHKQQSETLKQLELSLNKLYGDIQMLQTQNRTLVDWRTNVQFQLDGIINEVRKVAAINKNDANSCRLQEIGKDLTQLRNVLNGHQVTFKNEQVEMRQYQNDVEQKFKEVREFFVGEIGVTTTFVQDQRKEIERLLQESNSFKNANEELRLKMENMKQEIQELKIVNVTTAEKEKLKDVKISEMKRTMAQINLDVEVTERSFENIQGLIATTPGRLVWKIGDYSLKMENAKSNEKIPIKSPIFYTSDYGYRIRLVVYLNGIKKWRGRHLLACLHVMKGYYDDLLKWPCKIEANILLRDLDYEDKPKDFVRYITAKRNYPEDSADDPQESSTQYIFIPHATLQKANHLKNDAFYLEIVVNNQS